MTLENVFGDLRTLADRWERDAAARRRLWPDDPVAATMAHNAGELTAELTRLGHESTRVSVSEFAASRGVSVQCVRLWIRKGYLQASKTPHGYSISRTARVVRGRAA